MKILELFCGTKSISKVFKAAGHEVFTIDNERTHMPDLCIDILKFQIQDLPKEWRNPHIIWASPPCTCFSVCTISKNWIDGYPKNSRAAVSLALVLKTLELIKELHPQFWFIENPRGMLRKMPFMQNLHKKTVTYCQYGMKYQKPTDIWTNAVGWVSKKKCSPGSSCHEYQPRGHKSKKAFSTFDGGIQGLKNARDRGIIPPILCREILNYCENKSKLIQKQLEVQNE